MLLSRNKKPKYIDADEHSVAQWRAKKCGCQWALEQQAQSRGTAVAIEMSNGTTVSVDRVAVNNKVNLIKLKLNGKS